MRPTRRISNEACSGAETSVENLSGSCHLGRVVEDQIMDVTLATSVDEFFHEIVSRSETSFEPGVHTVSAAPRAGTLLHGGV